jgi:hypothetical protein
MTIQLRKIRQKIPLQDPGVRKVLGSQYIPLYLAQYALHLVQPTGMLGQPGDSHRKGEAQRSDPSAPLLQSGWGAMVPDQMHHLSPLTQGRSKQCQQKGLEICKSPGFQAGLC